MPSPDAKSLGVTKNALQQLRRLKLFKNLKICSEDRLNISRKLFNMSRHRVENSKKNYEKRSEGVEKPSDNSWITSGKLGSSDAVLVFRTDILNSRTQFNEETENDSDSSQYGKSNEDGLFDDDDENAASAYANTTRDAVIHTKSVQKLTTSEECSSDKNEKQDLNIKCDVHNDYTTISYYDTEERQGKILTGVSSDDEKTSGKDAESDAASPEESENSSIDVENGPYSPDMPAVNLNIKYKFIQTETRLLRKIFVRHGLSEVEGNDHFTILWTGIHMKPDILRNLAPYQRVNHFPRSYELTRKDRLYKNIEKMQHLRGIKHFDIVPQSFILPLEYKDLVSAHNKNRGPWIVKPAASSRGRGIFIVQTPDQIPADEQVLVSKYIANPLCIDGHKCDLRVYVLVTSFDPLLIYVYKEGLVRLATVKYDKTADNLWNPCMHLCNYSINKYHSDYIKSSDAHEEDVGHKWTLSALLRHLRSQGCDVDQLMANIEDIIIKSIFSCAQSIISACRMFVPNGNNCFELYGFDILIDDNLKPWLLEVNLSPSMGVDSPLDARVKASLIVDLLTLIGIPAYSPAMREHYDSKWSRFRNVNYTRRTTSAEPTIRLNNCNTKRGTYSRQQSLPLTIEEQRIIRNARFQNARRGGFIRIFPTNETMNKYNLFLDPSTGIPISTASTQGTIALSTILPHNYNAMIYDNLYGKNGRFDVTDEGNTFDERMEQYEQALGISPIIDFDTKSVNAKCVEEGKRLRKHILKLIDNGSEMTQLQARQCFALYLETILCRLAQESRDYHEKLILKFLNRMGGSIRAPVFFRNPQNLRSINKARSAMVAKLLGDFIEQYTKDTEAYVDTFDHYGMIPSSIFNEFLSQAHENDLEAVLTFHTNVTQTMPYLYNRFGLSVPQTPPIPSGVHGFLRALPAMVLNGSAGRDFNKHEGYYKNLEKEISEVKHKEKSKDSPHSKKKNRRKSSAKK